MPAVANILSGTFIIVLRGGVQNKQSKVRRKVQKLVLLASRTSSFSKKISSTSVYENLMISASAPVRVSSS